MKPWRTCRPLDLFAVNSFASAAQATFVLLLLPALAYLRGIPPTKLPDYMNQGAGPSSDHSAHACRCFVPHAVLRRRGLVPKRCCAKRVLCLEAT